MKSHIILAVCIFCISGASVAGKSADSLSSLDRVRNAFVEVAAASFAPDSETTDRFIEYSQYGRANDVLPMQLYNSVYLPDSEVERLLSAFDFANGAWKDIDYTSMDRGSWPSTLHVTRMYSLAKLYIAGPEKWRGSMQLHSLLHAAMNWWFTNRPVCPNWWHNQIGVPKKMAAIMLMLRDELSGDELRNGLEIIEKAKFGMTGQNKVWLAGNNLMRGLLIDDPGLVRQARDYIAEEIYITDKEGIQEDWSFHQHGPQMQFGNYGLAFADGIAFWLRVLSGSEYAFSPRQTQIICNLLKEGICWSVWKGVMDPSFCGRQVFIDGGTGKACALSVVAQNMAAALKNTSPEESSFFAGVAEENLQPQLFANTLTGGRYWWRSDCGVWRTPEWYASIRMHSERTIGFEFTNKENTLANFSADGAVMLMQDGKEFDNIFAIWDWRKVPGVTAYDDGKPIKMDDSVNGKKNLSTHVGGVAGEDAMAATMELDRDGLHALKSVFFFSDCIICIGADIAIERDDFQSVTTAIDQTALNGKVSSGKGWVHHNGRGYLILDGIDMKVSAEIQRGKWDWIDPAFHEKWDEGNVFKCWIEHPLSGLKNGKSGSYAYAMLPCRSERETATLAKKFAKGKSGFEILMNNAECQAVMHGDIICAVFHRMGRYVLAGQTFDITEPRVLIKSPKGQKSAPLPKLNFVQRDR